MEIFINIIAIGCIVGCVIFLIWVIKKHPEAILAFPKKIKFRKALWWWLDAGWKTYNRRGRRKYCTECGWPVVYIDELYDEAYIRESLTPNVIAVCSFCGVEFEEFEYSCGKRPAVLPIED